MASVVVCEDDDKLRATLSELCEAAGLHVVAETDRGADAVEIVRRFGVDVLLLDMLLVDGPAERVLRALQDLDPHPTIIIFTAYAGDPPLLTRLGASEIIEKPNLARLSAVLERVAVEGAAAEGDRPTRVVGEERRRTSRAVAAPPALWHSPSGISSARDLPASLRDCGEGDALLVIAVRGLEQLEDQAGPTLLADCHLAAARLLRQTLRTQDLVHESPTGEAFVAVLRGGDERTADAAWARLVELVKGADLPGELVGARARIDAMGGRDALARALAALQPTGPSAGPSTGLLITA